jgi:hypothetical protein
MCYIYVASQTYLKKQLDYQTRFRYNYTLDTMPSSINSWDGTDEEDSSGEQTTNSIADTQTTRPYPLLESLFADSHEHMSDPLEVCTSIKPYVLRAIGQTPGNKVLREILSFVDDGIASENHPSTWTCTTAQMHAIVGLLNHNQLLIEDGYEQTPAITNKSAPVCANSAPPVATAAAATLDEDASFLAELERFAL